MALNALFSQLLIGLINGSFYALLSLGLAVIFGMLILSEPLPGRFLAALALILAGLTVSRLALRQRA